jgi:hypothetical protein
MKHLNGKNWGSVIDRYIREGRTVSGGSPATQPTAQEITSGPSQIFVSPVWTALPTQLTTSPSTWPLTFPSPWRELGYTEKGVDLICTPTIKPFTPDEERSPVYDIPQAEKAELGVVVAQSILDNYALAVSAVALTTVNARMRKLSHGNLALTYVQVAVVGPSPVDPDASGTSVGDGVLAVFYKAISMAPITFGITRQNVRLFSLKWDARKLANQSLYDIYDIFH